MDLERHLRSYYEAWSRQDVEGVMDFFGEASTFEDLAFAAKFEGPEEIRSFVELIFAGAPDFEVRPTRILVGRDAVAAEWTMTGTHAGDYPGLPATGRRFEVRAASVISFEGDKIKAIVDYWNPVEFLRSVGVR